MSLVPEDRLWDTDVLIDYLRGREEAVKYIESYRGPLKTSAVTLAELYAGVRDGQERTDLEAFLTAFEIVPLQTEAAVLGGLFRRDCGKSHNVSLPDSLIAATAVHTGAVLVTQNKKHFPMLNNVLVPYRKP